MVDAPNEMENYICVFVDVLGAKGKGIDVVFAQALDKVITRFLDSTSQIGFIMRPISDGFVLALKNKQSFAKDCFYLFNLVSWISQHFLIDTESLLRGGIAFGKLYVGENLVFGEALIKAYSIESKEAIYPRIVVSNDIFQTLKDHQDVEAHAEMTLSILQEDFDGRRYIKQVYSIELERLQSISDKLRKRAIYDDYKYQKYVWWANTMNRDFADRGLSFRLET